MHHLAPPSRSGTARSTRGLAAEIAVSRSTRGPDPFHLLRDSKLDAVDCRSVVYIEERKLAKFDIILN